MKKNPKLLAEGVDPLLDPAAFSPDILRIQSQPPAPLPRAVLGTALVLFGAALVWAAFSKLDVVATATGKLIPESSIKIVQPAEAGIVKEILVQEGALVKAGQTLMRMDSTLSVADLAALRTEFQQKSLALRRIDAQLADKPFVRQPEDPPEFFAQTKAEYEANQRAQEAAIAEERATWERSRQEMAAAQATIVKLEQTLPHYKQQEAAYQKLLKDGFAGQLMADDKTRERIEKEQDYRTQGHVLQREIANMALSEKKIAQLQADYVRQLRSQRADISERVEKLRQELAKQDHRNSLLELKAPQDSRVKDLATHTIGTVTQPGTILMTLVPANETLLAEAWVSNDDVGFVHPGQPVKLKLATFQFQKYGMLDGVVEHVAADAVDQQEEAIDPTKPRPLLYRTAIRLKQQTLVADGVPYRLAPGMQVTAEIKLNDRTVLEYLLSPMQKAFHEAGRER